MPAGPADHGRPCGLAAGFHSLASPLRQLAAKHPRHALVPGAAGEGDMQGTAAGMKRSLSGAIALLAIAVCCASWAITSTNQRQSARRLPVRQKAVLPCGPVGAEEAASKGAARRHPAATPFTGPTAQDSRGAALAEAAVAVAQCPTCGRILRRRILKKTRLMQVRHKEAVSRDRKKL